LKLNLLNAELNPICHLLVLLEDLTFMGPCIVSIFQYTCISNKMQRSIVYLYLEPALHILGGTSIHHQESTKLYAVDTILCPPDERWKYHPKHAEQSPDINKLYNVASCWIYIGILLGAHPILHISKIRVKCQLRKITTLCYIDPHHTNSQ
jgi:hypothetical protein